MKTNPDSLSLTPAALLPYCRDCRDLSEWPERWMGEEKDLPQFHGTGGGRGSCRARAGGAAESTAGRRGASAAATAVARSATARSVRRADRVHAERRGGEGASTPHDAGPPASRQRLSRRAGVESRLHVAPL